MKFKLLLLSIILLSSCTDVRKDNITGSNGETFKVVTIDKCQYIIFYGFYSNANTVIVHKGNCNNPIHKY